MSRRLWLIAGGLVAAGAAFGLIPSQTIHAGGSADLVVTIRPAPGSPPRAVSVEAMNLRAAGEAVAARHAHEFEGGRWGATQRPFTGEPMRFPVPLGVVEREALLWDWSREWQYETLVVVWWPATGPRQAKAVSLPDLRTTRVMVVDVP